MRRFQQQLLESENQPKATAGVKRKKSTLDAAEGPATKRNMTTAQLMSPSPFAPPLPTSNHDTSSDGLSSNGDQDALARYPFYSTDLSSDHFDFGSELWADHTVVDQHLDLLAAMATSTQPEPNAQSNLFSLPSAVSGSQLSAAHFVQSSE